MDVNAFLVMWDCTGLECVIPYTNPEHDELIAVLSNKPMKNDIGKTLFAMTMRAKFNPQRYYEIYTVNAVDGIEKEDIEEMFENSPQHAADTIRKLGQMIFSDRPDQSKHIIT